MQLYKFQKDALDALSGYDNVLLAWQMGTGKTVSSIEQARRFSSDFLVCLVLKSTVGQWLECIEEQLPDHKAFNGYKKSKNDGIDAFISYTGKKALVLGYDAYKQQSAEKLRKYIEKNNENFTMICDESSLIGHMNSERTRAVIHTKTAHKILLSGTPAAGGRLETLIPSAHMLGWNISKRDFLNNYCVVKNWTNPAMPWVPIQIITGYKNIDDLHIQLENHGTSFITMEEAGVQLPETSDVFMDTGTLEKQYKEMKKDGITVIDGRQIVGDTPLTKMLCLRQICSIYSKERRGAVKELIEQADGERVVVFYNWNAEKDALIKICEELDRPASIVSGKEKNLKNYEKKKDCVIICQYQAAAMGLNLQKARIAIFYSPCLSYSDFEQAKARIHRIGQKKSVVFYYPLCKGSIEEKVYSTLKERKSYTVELFKQEIEP